MATSHELSLYSDRMARISSESMLVSGTVLVTEIYTSQAQGQPDDSIGMQSRGSCTHSSLVLLLDGDLRRLLVETDPDSLELGLKNLEIS
jgi:hypothetical protein